MLRIGRTGRVSRVAPAMRAIGGSALRRLLLIGGFVAVAWMLGSASASADEIGDVAPPAAEEAVAENAGKKADAAEQAGDAVERVSGQAPRSGTGAAAEGPADQETAEAAEAAEREVPPAAQNPGGQEALDVSEVVGQVGETGTEVTEKVGGSEGGADGRTEEKERAASEPDGRLAEKERPERHSDTGERGSVSTADGTHDAQQRESAADSEPSKGNGNGVSPDTLADSAAQSHSSSAPMVLYAGDLTTTGVTLPASGLHEAARNALDTVPRNPADDPGFSPD